MKRLITPLCLALLCNSAVAKEVSLNLTVNTQYPITAYYRFSGDNTLYGEGKWKHLTNNDVRKVAVNRIPDDQSVLVQIYKITVGGVTEINDPCEIRLEGSQLLANIMIGFTGDPNTHGTFTCTTALQA